MTQADRDRLVALKKAKKKLITQREAAEELGLSVRHVKRLIYALKKHGDKAVVHGLRGTAIEPEDRGEDRARGSEDSIGAGIRGFGPTLAAEYLRKKHGIEVEQRDGAAVDDASQAVAGKEGRM